MTRKSLAIIRIRKRVWNDKSKKFETSIDRVAEFDTAAAAENALAVRTRADPTAYYQIVRNDGTL